MSRRAKGLHVHTRRIMTSVALIRAAAVWPAFQVHVARELAVMIDGSRCSSDGENVTSAMRPLMRTLGDPAFTSDSAAHSAHYGVGVRDGAGGAAEEKAIHFTWGIRWCPPAVGTLRIFFL